MKTWIVFMGLFIISVGVLVYQGDIARYERQQIFLKAVAEECAAGAALLTLPEAYSQGETIFDGAGGQAYADAHLEYVMGRGAMALWKTYDCRLEFQDDERGYDLTNLQKRPTVTATITVSGQDLFRLPFISINRIQRIASYELLE